MKLFYSTGKATCSTPSRSRSTHRVRQQRRQQRALQASGLGWWPHPQSRVGDYLPQHTENLVVIIRTSYVRKCYLNFR